MRNFRELEIWKESMVLVKQVYQITKEFPPAELYGLVSQINRCAVSIPSNISEGCSKNSNKEFVRFLEISIGSAFELETQLLLSLDLEYIEEVKFNEVLAILSGLQKKINAFIKSVKNF